MDSKAIELACKKVFDDHLISVKSPLIKLSLVFVLQALCLFYFYYFVVKALTPLLLNHDLSDLNYLYAAAFISLVRFFLNLLEGSLTALLEYKVTCSITRELTKRYDEADPTRLTSSISPALIAEAVSALVPYFCVHVKNVRYSMVFTIVLLIFITMVNAFHGLILLCICPLLPVIMKLVTEPVKKTAKRQYKALSRLSFHFSEVLSNLSFIHLFNLERKELKTLKKVQINFSSKTLGILKIAFLTALGLEFVATFGIALCAITLGFDVYDNNFPYEKALLILFLCPELFIPLRTLGAGYHIRQKAVGVMEKLYADFFCIDTATSRSKPADTENLNEDSIEFENVSMKYHATKENYAYKNLSFLIKKNSLTLLKGPSGCGKSSVLHSILGWHSNLRGRIRIGNTDTTCYSYRDLIKIIAFMPQFPELFAATIKENLTAFISTDDESILKILKETNAFDIISRFEDGLEHKLDPDIDCFSSGELKLLALSRTLLANKKIILLDEPTSGLDKELTKRVTSLLNYLKKDHLVIVSTHDSCFDSIADRIIYLGEP
ncbi:MAG: ATP-binding cassette domain-containing protein [Succinivibrio sp.]